MWQPRPSGLSAGDQVRARSERWRVAGVRLFSACEALRLRGAGAGNHGAERTLLFPFDRPARLCASGRIERVGARAWRRRLVGICRETAPWDRLQTAVDARFDLLPYQLEPALATIGGGAVRVLLADEVGLGKTIQAALILRELRARGEADRVLIVAPAGLRDQWRSELADRFGLDSHIVDATLLRRAAAAMPRGTNPLTLAGIHILSIDFIKRPEVLQAVDETLWDVLVVDEAHALNRGTDRRSAGHALARRARRAILITATPHQGDEDAFRALCAIGAVASDDDPIVMFRRTRAELGLDTPRRTRLIAVRPTSAEARMHALLAAYAARVAQHAGRDACGHDALLAMTVLRKRSLSSARSLATSLERRLRWLNPAADPPPQLRLPLTSLDCGESSPEDDEPDAVLAAAGLPDAAAERAWLRAVLEAARMAAARESKMAALVRLLRRTREPVLIFTEYRDTLAHLARSLGSPVAHTVLHGGMPRADRNGAVRAFVSGAARVLLATDAAAEGLNLQARCRWVINLELPWTPLRLEQRIGRVDRLGQARRVHALHLMARDTAEGEILARLAARLSQVRASVGAGREPLPAPAVDEALVSTRTIEDGDAVAPLRPSNFRQIAEDEAGRIDRLRRLGAARLFAAPRITPPAVDSAPGRAWLTRRSGRRSTSRVALLCVFGARLADGRGHLAETFIVPVRVDVASRLDAIGPAIERARVVATEHVRTRCAHTIASRAALIERLAARERAIAEASAAGVAAELFQPGLFDRRAERTARARRERAERSQRRLAARLAALDAARDVRPSDGVELLLARFEA